MVCARRALVCCEIFFILKLISRFLFYVGAGKTTTINILTGRLTFDVQKRLFGILFLEFVDVLLYREKFLGATAPTSGFISVLGKNVLSEMSAIRQVMGICLQDDCLFPQLTVREHVQFFSRLKGLYRKVSSAEAETQVDQALIDVALSERRNCLSKFLSGGMKRKLSLAIAFCGGSDVVMLDEPTSGMDPFSRRFTWNVIRHYKKNRIIILTTHLMDEADVLGDRIAIMANGQLRCMGSSLFLKKTYGVGYQLTVDKCRGSVKHSDGLLEGERRVNPNVLLIQIITSYVPEAVPLGNLGAELRFSLPLNAAHSFVPMLLELEAQIHRGVISCFGISVTTLAEVFLRVSRGSMPTKFVSSSCPPTIWKPGGALTEGSQRAKKKEVALDLECDYHLSRHIVALMKKRGLSFRRDKKAWICTTIVPSLFVLIGFSIFAFTRTTLRMTSLVLDVSDYNPDLDFNQIIYNSPEFPFLCQPGVCSHLQPYYIDSLLNESYTFCGYESKLGISSDGFQPTNQTCSVADSSYVVSNLESSNIVLNDVPVGNVSEVSFAFHFPLLTFCEPALL